MSKLNNLIGFWNSKSAEHQEDRKVLSLSPRPTSRPKSEIIDRNFVKRMENFGGGEEEKEGPRERGGVRFALRRAPFTFLPINCEH